MAITPFMAAINQLCDEKGLTKETVVESLEAAVAAAYRKDYGTSRQFVKTKLDPEMGDFKPYQVFVVVEDEAFENDEAEKTLKEAKKMKKGVKLGDEIEIELPLHTDFGRIAAQTAKQVILQRLREAERSVILDEYKEKEGMILNGNIQQIEGETIIVNLGRANGLLLPSEQTPTERYFVGQRLKVCLLKVEETSRGPRLLVSRAAPNLINELFYQEVPEIQTGAVSIKNVVREAGFRAKIAVESNDKNLDPVGSCVGQRGTRVQAVLAEIGDEKIDIILFDKEDKQYIENALSPAKVEEVKLNKKTKHAAIKVAEDQLSLAIGKSGQNVRLASRLTGWEIDIIKPNEKAKNKEQKEETKPKEEAEIKEPKKIKKEVAKTEAEDGK